MDYGVVRFLGYGFLRRRLGWDVLDLDGFGWGIYVCFGCSSLSYHIIGLRPKVQYFRPHGARFVVFFCRSVSAERGLGRR